MQLASIQTHRHRERRAWRRSLTLRLSAFAVWLAAGVCAGAQAADQVASPALPTASSASIHGTVRSTEGAVYQGAHVELRLGDEAAQSEETDSDGAFTFRNLLAGAFRLIVSSNGFETQNVAGVLKEGQPLEISTITLPMANADTVVQVSAAAQAELAQEQLNVEEEQRVLGIIPNYYVNYDRDAIPLTTRQKFQLAWKSEVDPVSWAFAGAVAGVEQANNSLSGYGQGAQGYGKRFGANYANGFVGTMIGNAILPSWLRQDPRYFYKGTGRVTSRAAYAIANSVICKGDNGRWQPAYSAILGGLAAGGVANLYYPASDRSGLTESFENLAIGTVGSAVQDLFQEFVVRKFTPRLPHLYSKDSR